MEAIKDVVEYVCSPAGILSVLILSGIVLSLAGNHARLARRLLTTGGLLFLIFLFTPLSEYLILGLEEGYSPLLYPPASPTVNRIVVLAGYAEEHPGFPVTSTVSEETMCSMSEGLRLYRLVPGAKLILSGGVVRKGDRPVGASMSDFLSQMGVPGSDLIVEGNSRNTYENLFEVKKLVGSDPFILVALAPDLRRANAVARKLQMNPIPAPACIMTLQHHANLSTSERIGGFFKSFEYPSTNRLPRLQWAYHEYLGYLWYSILGRI
jgi:uncharacterized SAM-binding protein YcdF (DUF218 family)